MNKEQIMKREQTAQYTEKVFKAKERLRRSRAGLSIKEKLKIMVKLQKIALSIRKSPDAGKLVKAWKLD